MRTHSERRLPAAGGPVRSGRDGLAGRSRADPGRPHAAGERRPRPRQRWTVAGRLLAAAWAALLAGGAAAHPVPVAPRALCALDGDAVTGAGFRLSWNSTAGTAAFARTAELAWTLEATFSAPARVWLGPLDSLDCGADAAAVPLDAPRCGFGYTLRLPWARAAACGWARRSSDARLVEYANALGLLALLPAGDALFEHPAAAIVPKAAAVPDGLLRELGPDELAGSLLRAGAARKRISSSTTRTASRTASTPSASTSSASRSASRTRWSSSSRPSPSPTHSLGELDPPPDPDAPSSTASSPSSSAIRASSAPSQAGTPRPLAAPSRSPSPTPDASTSATRTRQTATLNLAPPRTTTTAAVADGDGGDELLPNNRIQATRLAVPGRQTSEAHSSTATPTSSSLTLTQSSTSLTASPTATTTSESRTSTSASATSTASPPADAELDPPPDLEQHPTPDPQPTPSDGEPSPTDGVLTSVTVTPLRTENPEA